MLKRASGSFKKRMRCFNTFGPMKAQRSWISFRKPARKKGGPKAVRRIFERGRVGFLGERNVERAEKEVRGLSFLRIGGRFYDI